MRAKFIIFAILFQILALLGMLGYAYAPLYFGKEMKVGVSLYDPRDFLRGNYVKITYDFANNLPKYIDKNTSVRYGTKIYITFKKDENGTFVRDGYSFEKPKNAESFIVGRFDGYYYKFGTEAFFMSPQAAKKMESDMRKYGGYAILMVSKNGNARIKELFPSNQPRPDAQNLISP
ncbi:GDYXXLXY domain-containing protein [Campylobacter sp. faydin G-24]|uniref:GDYXXLXY domain-containing protein n=1 Tax=Campylobacter anatolicus TaxID=2829105 RepID=A0ABS5HI69_9BACT|nr:GDYXXLXY domain-containing protein [Campylobacter anatolicus]MBR8463974.1 GDYXXLXY domain-containing protein [Campylobacter anatolicus]